MQHDKDSVWIDKWLAGDQQAFRQLVVNHKDMIYTISFNILKNQEEAEDVAQMVFVKAFQKIDTFKRTALFSTWLYRIAYNLSISELRKRKQRFTVVDGLNFEKLAQTLPDGDTDEIEKKEVEANLLLKAIDDLEADERGLISLYYIQDQSVEQISTITGLGQSNVKTKMFRIRKKLHAMLLTQKIH
ncbi:MAG: sigma-70 family RNA polymerase sigma factor [Bacteroidales bacterium]|nr:sigma-70 family RNA polymerase sigma factor [Bacteroidales bacterium]